MARTDTERLNWLEENGFGCALINDDAGRWAFSGSGEQPIPEAEPIEMWTTFHVEAHEWRPSIREAIDAAMDAESEARDD